MKKLQGLRLAGASLRLVQIRYQHREDKAAYDLQARELSKRFRDNFDKYRSKASADILSSEPRI